MTVPRAFVVGLGAVGAFGRGVPALLEALRAGRRPLAPLTLFDFAAEAAPPIVGEVAGVPDDPERPRTHVLALEAAREALRGATRPPDAVVLGVTTGGISTTERLLAAGEQAPERYRLHGAGTVAETLAHELGCRGPVLTVATACSSGAVALKIALELIRAGRARNVLAGGADALCRLTVHGFHLLQLIDPHGPRPLDRDRRGMAVAEAAAMLLLTAADTPPAGALAELRGGGLTCDAHHPSQPLPSGEGARCAMERALLDAGAVPAEVDYVNLHGTGTMGNDAAEAAAIRALWTAPPPLSSTKGLTGHPLAAAGAVEAAISVLALHEGFLPPNVGLEHPDPALGLDPLRAPLAAEPRLVLSNSFGFGGNNAVLAFGRPDAHPGRATAAATDELEVLGAACISGAGATDATAETFLRGAPCGGVLPDDAVGAGLPPRLTRRLRRLPRLALALADAAERDGAAYGRPKSVFAGTAWGPLSETHEFLARLFQSGGRFSSPTEFVGSVHNAPAGQLAMYCGAKGPNVTATAGDASFEQALLLAALLAGAEDEPILLAGFDEAHAVFGPLLEPLPSGEARADGGGALLVRRAGAGAGIRVRTAFLASAPDESMLPEGLVPALGGGPRVRDSFGAIFARIPVDEREAAERRLDAFRRETGFAGPVLDIGRALGHFAAASAVATVMAVRLLRDGRVPAALAGGRDVALEGRGVLLLGLGRRASALEVRG